MGIVNEFKNHLKDFDFCASRFDDAWCEHVSPLGPEFVADWLSAKGINLEDDQLELILELSDLVLGAFIRSLISKGVILMIPVDDFCLRNAIDSFEAFLLHPNNSAAQIRARLALQNLKDHLPEVLEEAERSEAHGSV
jgi:hypothetical protein